MWRKKYYQNPRRLALAAVAKETEAMTPTIASALSHLDPARSEKLDLGTLPPLDAARCPRFGLAGRPVQTFGTTVRVLNEDSFDAAVAMPSAVLGSATSSVEKSHQAVEAAVHQALRSLASSPENLAASTAARVAVLNMASERNPGGGWLKGASAQEEALCFRSTLAASLRRNFYPIESRAGLYTRDVVVFRKSMADQHQLMVPETAPASLPVVSALSVAGIRRPDVRPAGSTVGPDSAEDLARTKAGEGGEQVTGEQSTQGGSKAQAKTKASWKQKEKERAPSGPLEFADPAARDLTKDKMRLVLRMAGAKGHTMLVLGAIGCGAFRNPPREIAKCWQEVLGEDEFAGGWFKEIWFAVFDRRNEGNFEVFEEEFDGKAVGERVAVR